MKNLYLLIRIYSPKLHSAHFNETDFLCGEQRLFSKSQSLTNTEFRLQVFEEISPTLGVPFPH